MALATSSNAAFADELIDTGAGQVAYSRIGSGSAIVFLHDYGHARQVWHHQLTALPDFGCLYAFDLLGSGSSAAPTLEYTPETYLSWLLDLFRALRISSVTLIGSGFGAAVALAFATRHAGQVQRLMLIGPTIPGVQPAGQAMYWHFWLVHHRRFAGFMPQGWTAVSSRYAWRDALHQPKDTDAGLIRMFCAAQRGAHAQAYISTARHWHEWLAHRPQVAALPMPVAAIWGRHDRLSPVRQAPLLQTLIPQLALTLLNCGHLPHVECPAEVNALLRSFLGAEARAVQS